MSLPYGKIHPKFLEKIVFNYLGFKRNDVILGPSKGEDAALIKVGKELIVASCDPISGSIKNIGWLAVNVSANDVATRGVKPCWFLSCILLPKNSKLNVLKAICKQMDLASKKLEIAIVGGHTEVSLGLTHPIVVGFCAGKVEEGKYVSCNKAKPGGKRILTKGAGIEGTAILATEKEKELVKFLGKKLIEKAKKYMNLVSVVKEALMAFNFGGVQAMHDPTEGGVLGGLCELIEAANLGAKIYEDKIPINEETAAICNLFKINPLQLISSGSLLIVADPNKAEKIVNKLKDIGIKASIIGETLPNSKERYIISKNGKTRKLLMPKTDELWKALGRKFFKKRF
ncbi:MAG: AIR synthase family protein [Candidatus Bathyarchaeia archaeon]